MATFRFVLLDYLLMQRLSEILQLASAFMYQRVMPSSRNWIPRIKKPARHLFRTAPSPMRRYLLRLHILEPSLFEMFLDLLRRRPFRARHHGRFVARMYLLTSFGPWIANARVVGINPRVHG